MGQKIMKERGASNSYENGGHDGKQQLAYSGLDLGHEQSQNSGNWGNRCFVRAETEHSGGGKVRSPGRWKKGKQVNRQQKGKTQSMMIKGFVYKLIGERAWEGRRGRKPGERNIRNMI